MQVKHLKHPSLAVAILIGFGCLGLLVFVRPLAALALAGSVIAVMVVRSAPLTSLKLFAAGLVILPMAGWFRGGNMQSDAARLAEGIESGSWENRIAFTLLLAIGLILLARVRREIGRINLLPWVALYLGLAFLSLLWSQSAILTLRRAIEVLFIFVFAFGVGSAYYGRRPDGHIALIRTLCWMISFICGGVIVLSIFRGEFHIADPSWRLGREGVENEIGWVASVGFLVAWVTKSRKDIWPRRSRLWLIMVVSGLALALTKSRESWLGVIAAIFLLELLKPRAFLRRLGGLAVFGALLGALWLSPAFQEQWKRGASEEGLETASGRTDLWQDAAPLIQSHLWLGYGFGAFWTGKTVMNFSSDWNPTSLHNGYLDTISEIGVVGLALALILFGISLVNAWRLMRQPGNMEIGLTLLVLAANLFVINCLGGVLQLFNYLPYLSFQVYSFFIAQRLAAPSGGTARVPIALDESPGFAERRPHSILTAELGHEV